VTLQRSADDCLALADAALAALPHGEAEVTVTETDAALTRFAHNAIHQNVAESSLRLRLRLIHDRRVGVADMRGGAGDGAVARLIGAAEDARRLAAPVDVPPLPAPDGAGGVCGWSDATAGSDPEDRADRVAVVARAAAVRGLRAFGAMSTDAVQTAIVNTRGLRRHGRRTAAQLSCVVRGEDGAGYADRVAVDVGDIDSAALAAEVVDCALRNQQASPISPGDYEVVLSPYAVAEMIEYLSYIGLSALAVQERRSYVHLGERQMGEPITLRDDAGDAAVLPFAFDAEGVATHAVTLVERGVSRAVVYDTPTARHDGVASTGHALPQPNTIGPLPRHLVLDAGGQTVEELVAAVERGLYVTRFWYVRPVHALRTVITGMTREGTFLIEHGRLSRPVRDLRFTQSIVAALDDVRGISRERRLEATEESPAVLAPWLHLGSFSFTS